MHVLPHRFTKIRHYGFISNRFRSSKVTLIRKFIARQRGIVLPVIKSLSAHELLLKIVGKERLCCPKCGKKFNFERCAQCVASTLNMRSITNELMLPKGSATCIIGSRLANQCIIIGSLRDHQCSLRDRQCGCRGGNRFEKGDSQI